MFSNQCVGTLDYEGTTAAVVMAGMFIAWIIEYGSLRAARKFFSQSTYNDEVVTVMVLEAGIIFHSICKLFHGRVPHFPTGLPD